MPLLADLTLGRYVATDSVLHRLDPRTKFLAALVLMTAVLATRSFASLFLSVALVVAAVGLSGLPVGLVLRNLRPFVWLFALTLLLHALLTPGRLLWQVPWTDTVLTVEGARLGAYFALRLAVVVLIAALLTLTTSPTELTDGLERLLAPLRRVGLPAHELAVMITISLRFIPVLVEEAERLHKAQLARGADFGGGPLRRARSLIPLLVPLFVSAFARADRLALAMESRCYRGGVERTSFRQLAFGLRDAVAAAAVVLAAAILWGGPRLWPGLP
jgi:energy-coupling factor transport system permease protein